MIDLHTHTNESDGTRAPSELIQVAKQAGLQSLAITDHDTFAGYLQAREAASQQGVDLIRGIEVSTKHGKKSIHILGYFFRNDPPDSFLKWLESLVAEREERNRLLSNQLRTLGVDVTLEEAQALGRTVTGRVHFARVMVQKGYVRSIQAAFDRYLADNAPAYVEANDPPSETAVEKLRSAGAFPVVAHLGRYGMAPEKEEDFLSRLRNAGLGGLEVIHTDHAAEDVTRYATLAAKYSLLPSGGSDYHGEAKPGVRLGFGDYGKIPIPPQWLARMREAN